MYSWYNQDKHSKTVFKIVDKSGKDKFEVKINKPKVSFQPRFDIDTNKFIDLNGDLESFPSKWNYTYGRYQIGLETVKNRL